METARTAVKSTGMKCIYKRLRANKRITQAGRQDTSMLHPPRPPPLPIRLRMTGDVTVPRDARGLERKSDAGAAGGGRASSRSTAAVSDPSLVESGLQMPKDHSDAAAEANATASRAVLGLPSESEGVAGEGGVEDEQVEVQGIGGGMVVGVGPAGFTGGLARPARVLIVEEPWQSIYLWSVVFVRTAWDVRLFDTRTVRLFEVGWRVGCEGNGCGGGVVPFSMYLCVCVCVNLLNCI